jgi:hypothetical protein
MKERKNKEFYENDIESILVEFKTILSSLLMERIKKDPRGMIKFLPLLIHHKPLRTYHDAYVKAFFNKVKDVPSNQSYHVFNNMRKIHNDLQDKDIRFWAFFHGYFSPWNGLYFVSKSLCPSDLKEIKSLASTRSSKFLGEESVKNILNEWHKGYLHFLRKQKICINELYPKDLIKIMDKFTIPTAIELVSINISWMHEECVRQKVLPIFKKVQEGKCTEDEEEWVKFVFARSPVSGQKKISSIKLKKSKGRPSDKDFLDLLYKHELEMWLLKGNLPDDDFFKDIMSKFKETCNHDAGSIESIKKTFHFREGSPGKDTLKAKEALDNFRNSTIFSVIKEIVSTPDPETKA